MGVQFSHLLIHLPFYTFVDSYFIRFIPSEHWNTNHVIRRAFFVFTTVAVSAYNISCYYLGFFALLNIGEMCFKDLSETILS